MTDTNSPPTSDQDDIVTINAGGKIFQILRSTLCLPPEDTAFCKLFRSTAGTSSTTKPTSNHNTVAHTKDANGNYFLDFDPELIEIVLNFLRMKKIEDPFDPIVEPPSVPRAKTKDFKRLLNHFGLTAFFYYPSTSAATTNVGPTGNIMVHNIRKMSLDSHENVVEAAATIVKHHDSLSWASPEDASIAEGFEYCYG